MTDQNQTMGRTRRSTRHSLRLDDIDIHGTRRRSRVKEEIEMADTVKENGSLLRRVNRKSKNEHKDDDDDDDVEENGNCLDKTDEGNVEDNQQQEEQQQQQEQQQKKEVVENGEVVEEKVNNFSSGRNQVKKTRNRTAVVNNRLSGNVVFFCLAL